MNELVTEVTVGQPGYTESVNQALTKQKYMSELSFEFFLLCILETG